MKTVTTILRGFKFFRIRETIHGVEGKEEEDTILAFQSYNSFNLMSLQKAYNQWQSERQQSPWFMYPPPSSILLLAPPQYIFSFPTSICHYHNHIMVFSLSSSK